MSTEKKPWAEFSRFHWDEKNRDDFYGCVDKDGVWFDSGYRFETALHWCCYAAGQFDLNPTQELEWFSDEGRELGYSIIHGSLIHQMYEAGLIK